MKHNFKKLMALVIAAIMMVAMVVPTMADTNNLTKDDKISVSGLQQGDSVTFYRVLKFDEDATTTGGWVNDTGFNLTEAQIQKALAIDSTTHKQVTITPANQNLYGIDADLAATIADMAENTGVSYTSYTVVADSTGKAEKSTPEEGLYVAIITPAKAGNLYNPVFVGADYQENNSNAWTVNLNDTYQPASMAKKGEIDLTKTASTGTEDSYDDQEPATVAVGDVVSFTIETTIPEFADNYNKPVFKITDQLTKGLDLKVNTIKVYHTTVNDDHLLGAANSYAYGKAYKLTTTDTGYATSDVPAASYTAGGDSYVVDFFSEYIKELTASQKIIIKYDAVVLDTAITSMNIEDNTVTLNFSNNPTDETGHGIMKDETKHYTFDIDATLFGDSSYPASELVKIGLDKDGKEITNTIELPGNKNQIGALQGAKFKLYVANANSSTKIKNEQGTEINASVYNNGIYDADTEFVSDANGRITAVDADVAGIRGLDAGTYYLVETDAPDGYIKAQNGVKIVIDAIIEDETHKTYYDKVTGTEYNAQDQEGTLTEVTWTVPELKSYSVTINDVETANYTMTNEEKPNKGDGNDVMNPAIGEDGLIGATDAGSGAANGKIQNTQGVELPSTGGIGTTLFYTIGAILIIGAGIVLITRRRMSVQ